MCTLRSSRWLYQWRPRGFPFGLFLPWFHCASSQRRHRTTRSTPESGLNREISRALKPYWLQVMAPIEIHSNRLPRITKATKFATTAQPELQRIPCSYHCQQLHKKENERAAHTTHEHAQIAFSGGGGSPLYHVTASCCAWLNTSTSGSDVTPPHPKMSSNPGGSEFPFHGFS